LLFPFSKQKFFLNFDNLTQKEFFETGKIKETSGMLTWRGGFANLAQHAEESVPGNGIKICRRELANFNAPNICSRKRINIRIGVVMPVYVARVLTKNSFTTSGAMPSIQLGRTLRSTELQARFKSTKSTYDILENGKLLLFERIEELSTSRPRRYMNTYLLYTGRLDQRSFRFCLFIHGYELKGITSS
jgi:hypothetical protein